MQRDVELTLLLVTLILSAVWRTLSGLISQLPEATASKVLQLVLSPTNDSNHVHKRLLQVFHLYLQARYHDHPAKYKKTMDVCRKVVHIVLKVPHRMRVVNLEQWQPHLRLGRPHRQPQPQETQHQQQQSSHMMTNNSSNSATSLPPLRRVSSSSNNSGILPESSSPSMSSSRAPPLPSTSAPVHHHPVVLRFFSDLQAVSGGGSYDGIPTNQDLMNDHCCRSTFDWEGPAWQFHYQQHNQSTGSNGC